jgi:hypothetical protein
VSTDQAPWRDLLMNTVLTTRNAQVRVRFPEPAPSFDLAGATFQVSPIDGRLTITFVGPRDVPRAAPLRPTSYGQ